MADATRWLRWIREPHYASSRGSAPLLSKAERAARDELVVATVRRLCEAELARRREWAQRGDEFSWAAWHSWRGVSAADVAIALGAQQAMRLGNGAKRGSSTGWQPVAVRVQALLRSLAGRELLLDMTHDYRHYYTPPDMPWYDAERQAKEAANQ